MQIRVLLFGILKEIVGHSSESLELREGARLQDVLDHYSRQFPSVGEMRLSLALAVNQEYAALSSTLQSGDEVALLPPVSGGSGEGAESSDGGVVAIVREPIDVDAVLRKIKRPPDGAAVVFDGVVRDQTRGRPTQYLEYEAYESMAAKQLRRLAQEARSRFQVRDVSILHRLGRLEIGDTSVLIVVTSAHRAAAFDACRWMIDTLKKTVPIWKKEYFADGAVWADGEPFPDEIPRAGGPV